MLEKDIQKRFFDILINQEKGHEKTAVGVYQKLVFYRFEEIIQNTFLEFCKEVSENEQKELIIAFMKDTPSTAFVWQIAKDFILFVKKNKIFEDRPYLYELLYFDWIEVEIQMREYKDKKPSKFSWNKKYKLSKSARIIEFEYDILNANIKEKKHTPTLIYLDFEDNEVKFREINPFVYELLKRVDKKEPIKKYLKDICKENEIDFKEAKEVLGEVLEQILYFRGIK